jgi:2',3'-cyclic-nucleotide 2'-phosphodiesterase (5'-nucleotidase family)
MGDEMVATARGPSLRVICVNDVYTLANLPRLKSLVQHHAAVNPADRLLVTLAGDFIAPSILSGLDKGAGMIDCLNAIPITHVVFGNHEDDVGMAELVKRVGEFRGTWLNTNMPAFRPALPTHQILEVTLPGGRTVRVGLLGLVAHQQNLYRPGAFGGHAIEPTNEAALHWTRRLFEEGCACVIPITHQDLADDQALARMQREPRFPIIIAGHDHEVIIDDVDGCRIIKAGAEAAQAVVVDLVWPADAPPPGAPDLPAVTLMLQEVHELPEDPAMRARVDRHMSSVHRLDEATLIRIPQGAQLSSVGITSRQTSMGTVLCSHVRDALEADGCLLHGGGVRGGRDYEARFTYADLKAALPYANETAVVRMSGRVVRDAIAMSRAGAKSNAAEGSNAYLQVDDRMTVEGPDDVVTAIGGLPIDLERDYRIATVMGLLGGMNGIEPLLRHAQERPDTVPPRDSGREIKVILVDAFSVELWKHLGSFGDIDADRDGVVTSRELESAIVRTTAEAPSEIVVHDVLRILDTDGDGTITRAEAEAIGHDHAGQHTDAQAGGTTSAGVDPASQGSNRP